MRKSFAEMPDTARVWVFAAPRPLLDDEAEKLLDHVDAFVDGWVAHGHSVVGARDFRHRQFLVLAADEEATGVSGCSIDSLYDALKTAERELGVSLLDSASRVWYRADDGEVRAVARSEFRQMIRSGAVTDETPVFDNTVATAGELRGGRWERPMRESWHAAAFG